MIKLAITKSGSQGMKVSRIDTTLGRTIRMFVSKNADLVAAEQACANYLFRAAQNEELSLEFQKAAAEAYQNFLWNQAAPAVTAVTAAPAAEPSPEPAALEPVSHEEQFAEFHGLARGITMAAGTPEMQEIRWTMLRDLAATVTHLYLLASIVDYCHRHAIDEDYQLSREFGFACKCGELVKDEGQSCGSCATDAVMHSMEV